MMQNVLGPFFFAPQIYFSVILTKLPRSTEPFN